MSTEIATLEVNHTSVYADGDYLFPKMMAEEMGLDWNGQRQRIERSPWSDGMTCVTHVLLPTDTKGATDRFAMHQRIVPMWIASIDTARVREEVRPVVEAWQKEIAEVLAEHYYPTKKPRPEMTDEERAFGKLTRRVRSIRKSVAGDGPVGGEVQRILLNALLVHEVTDLKAEADAVRADYTYLKARILELGTQLDQVQKSIPYVPPTSNYHDTPGQNGDGGYDSQNR